MKQRIRRSIAKLGTPAAQGVIALAALLCAIISIFH